MRAIATAQPNIALVKYWGKRDVDANLPAVGSLSVTLDSLWTRMAVEFGDAPGRDRLEVNGEPAPGMVDRVSRCLDGVAGRERPAAAVTSTCNFPIGAGLASSASAFAALVVAAAGASGGDEDTKALARIAGRASGSAARSLYGGIVELSAGEDDIDLETLAAPGEWPLAVTVAVTETAAKPVGSSEAMTISARTSPFYTAWLARQPDDLAAARRAVRDRDFETLAAVAEHNCLKMHSVMFSSRPALVYWNAATLACLETVRELRRQGVPVFFTIDAGPQVKAVSLPGARDAVSDALGRTPGVVEVLTSALGSGARLVESS